MAIASKRKRLAPERQARYAQLKGNRIARDARTKAITDLRKIGVSLQRQRTAITTLQGQVRIAETALSMAIERGASSKATRPKEQELIQLREHLRLAKKELKNLTRTGHATLGEFTHQNKIYVRTRTAIQNARDKN